MRSRSRHSWSWWSPPCPTSRSATSSAGRGQDPPWCQPPEQRSHKLGSFMVSLTNNNACISKVVFLVGQSVEEEFQDAIEVEQLHIQEISLVILAQSLINQTHPSLRRRAPVTATSCRRGSSTRTTTSPSSRSWSSSGPPKTVIISPIYSRKER